MDESKRNIELKLSEAQLRIEELETLTAHVRESPPVTCFEKVCEKKPERVTIVVIGASGDLAKKKTYPALFSLFLSGLLPKKAIIYGYARSKLSREDFIERISSYLKTDDDSILQSFLKKCHYFSGQYDSAESFKALSEELSKHEPPEGSNRIFYLAIPPSVFVDTAKSIKSAESQCGWTRVVVEKPFGHDSESSNILSKELGALYQEDQLYRIDHYLGKEMVQNLMVLRFANSFLEPLWNRQHISSVIITFKENIGTDGRGGYFDNIGIIRDVMQNHLFQILSLVAMEPPVSLAAEDVRDEKVKVLRSTAPLHLDDVVVGQYDGYLDDDTVPEGSTTATFALAVFHIKNTRWEGVPFILKCGKALNERKAEVRVQFRKPPAGLFGNTTPANELVIRVQPNEAIYLKMVTKQPGLNQGLKQTELDLTYKDRFDHGPLPDAYERLIWDVIRGDHNLFVRADELEAAWNIFTPVLHQLEREKKKPISYEFGSRGPVEADNLASQYGYVRYEGYSWPKL